MDLFIVINMPGNNLMPAKLYSMVCSSSCLLLLGAGVYKDSYQLLSIFFSWRSVANLEFVMKLVFLH